MPIEGFQPYWPEDVERYIKYRWWLGLTWGDMFDKATDLYPGKEGLVDDTARFRYHPPIRINVQEIFPNALM